MAGCGLASIGSMGGSIGNATDRWYPPTAAYSAPMISIRFLGAAGGVTGSQFLLTVGDRRVVVDCGLFQGGMDEIARNRMAFSYGAEDVHAVLLTHAHNDHIGRLPALVRAGYHGPVFATDATADLAEIVLVDSAELQARRGTLEAAAPRGGCRARARRRVEATASEMEMAATAARMPRPPDLETRTHAPLFDVDDVRRTMELVRPVSYTTATPITDGIEATFHDAGHILGSSIIELRVRDPDGTEQTVVFSGDLGRDDTPILRDPTPLTHADAVVVGVDLRRPGARARRTGGRGASRRRGRRRAGSGVLLVPAFAMVGPSTSSGCSTTCCSRAGSAPATLRRLADGLRGQRLPPAGGLRRRDPRAPPVGRLAARLPGAGARPASRRRRRSWAARVRSSWSARRGC